MEYKYRVIELTNKSAELERSLNHFGMLHYRLVDSHLIGEHLQLILERLVEE